MLKDKEALATIPVKDLNIAKRFYGDTLGLPPATLDGDGEPGAIEYRSGTSTVLVYQSQFAGSNQATAITWEVDDVEREVDALRAKGVTFERYDDIPGMKRNGDVHLAGRNKAAWFKDPDGNILAIVGP